MIIPIPYPIACEERTISDVKPYFYEFDGCILNLSIATKFYVDHIPLSSLYWPSARIGRDSYKLTSSMDSEEKALEFLRDLVKKIQKERNNAMD